MSRSVRHVVTSFMLDWIACFVGTTKKRWKLWKYVVPRCLNVSTLMVAEMEEFPRSISRPRQFWAEPFGEYRG